MSNVSVSVLMKFDSNDGTISCPIFSSGVSAFSVWRTHCSPARSSVNGSRGAAGTARHTSDAATTEVTDDRTAWRRRMGRIVTCARATMARMSQAEHKARAPESVRCFIVTVSDTRTEATDSSGSAIAALLTAAGHVVAGRAIVRDEPDDVRGMLERQLANTDVQAIIATGGTGITSRDSTY